MGRGEPTFANEEYAICCGRRMQRYSSKLYVEEGRRFVYRWVRCLVCGNKTTVDNEVPEELQWGRKKNREVRRGNTAQKGGGVCRPEGHRGGGGRVYRR